MSSKPYYTLEYSEWLKQELHRLENGTGLEKQRYRNVLTTIAKIQSDPLNYLFNKTLPDNYKAADVLQQYRLFFKIYNFSDDAAVVFLAWMNDDQSIHRSGEKDDAYAIFRQLHARGDIETYVPSVIQSQPVCNQRGNWGNNAIYFELSQTLNTDFLRAYSHLYLSKQSDTEYRIDSISVSHTGMGLAQSLLDFICRAASQAHIIVYHELNINLSDVDKSRHILAKFGFILDDSIEDVEIWTKQS